MDTILVTGAGGYIGSHACYTLLKQGYSVVGVDNFQTGYRQPLEFFASEFPSQFKYREVSLLTDDLSLLFTEYTEISTVIHFAASCSVDESMKNPSKYFTNNVQSCVRLMDAMKDAKVSRLIFSSTCALYGPPEYIPVDEKHPTNPESPYGESKLLAEKIIRWYGKLFGMQYVILRYFNVCGASDDGRIGDSKKPSLLLVQNAVRGAMNIEPFSLTCGPVDTPDGTPIRDYINVNDLVEAHAAALEYLKKGGESTLINLGTGTGNSVKEIVNAVQKITGVAFPVQKGAARQGESAKIVADTKKAHDLLGWTAKRTIEDSVQSLRTWYTTHPNGWEK
jgi:UDP-glucose 4-epimerase